MSFLRGAVIVLLFQSKPEIVPGASVSLVSLDGSAQRVDRAFGIALLVECYTAISFGGHNHRLLCMSPKGCESKNSQQQQSGLERSEVRVHTKSESVQVKVVLEFHPHRHWFAIPGCGRELDPSSSLHSLCSE